MKKGLYIATGIAWLFLIYIFMIDPQLAEELAIVFDNPLWTVVLTTTILSILSLINLYNSEKTPDEVQTIKNIYKKIAIFIFYLAGVAITLLLAFVAFIFIGCSISHCSGKS